MQLEVERVDLNPLVCERESSSALRSSRSTFHSMIRPGRIKDNCMSPAAAARGKSYRSSSNTLGKTRLTLFVRRPEQLHNPVTSRDTD